MAITGAITGRIRRSHYRLLGLVGHGQFGRVYCAVHRGTGELVALKDLNRERFSTHKFLRELRFLLSLEHPNIATCQALEHSATGRQLVLDYCEGGTLRYLIENEVPLSVLEILNFISDILQALDHAHRQGIVHCDIKPENVLLTITPGGWQARISDFGIARLSLEGKEGELGNSGSPAYMAPERFYHQYSAASDLYAVGIILYELLTGQRPFSGTPSELMGAHLNQWPALPDGITSPLREIILKALQKLLARRYKSAAEMLSAVRDASQQLLQANPEQAHRAIVRATLLSPVPLAIAPPQPFITVPHPVELLGQVTMPPADSPGSPAAEPTVNHWVLVGHHQQGWFYYWTGQRHSVVGYSQGFTLPFPIRQFRPLPDGGCLFTEKSIHVLSMKHGLVAIARFNHAITATISPDGNWFAACNAEVPHGEVPLMVRRLVREPGQPIRPTTLHRVALSAPFGDILALEAVDSRHFLAVISGEGKTAFQGFTRRGTRVGTLHLATRISTFVPTQQPYRLLALEADCPEAVLVIDVKPFRVFRYRLDIQPRWLFHLPLGYLAISAQGSLRILSEEGQSLGGVDHLPHPVSVIPISATQLLWAVSEENDSRIYTIDLTQLGLDIIF